MEKKLNFTLTFVIITSLLLLGGAVFPEAALRDAVSMLPVSQMHLAYNWAYLLIAPWLNILDLMSSLSITQHITWMLMLLFVCSYLMFRVIAQYKQGLNQFLHGLIAILLGFVCMLLIYAVAMLVPRPMSAIVVPEADMLVVDFHSHTNASHDANTGFDAEDNRQWHQHAGFDAVFVTDHSTFDGILAGKPNNQAQAKDGVQLMNGVEVFHKGGHILALCATQLVQKKAVYHWQKHPADSCVPLLLQALPAPIHDSDTTFRERNIEAIEINDGAPLGLEEVKNREQLMEKAKRLNIAVVSGSDNHGWAYAATGWSILHIKSWQTMNANALALAITNRMRDQGFTAVQVVERNMLLPATNILGHITMPARLIWHMFRTLSLSERLSWLVWLALFAFVFGRRKRN